MNDLIMIVLFFQAATLVVVGFLIYTVIILQFTTERQHMSLQDTVDQITAELARAHGELTAEIAKLQAQVDAAGVAEQVDLSALQNVADALDGIVPDEPTEPEGDLEIVKRDDTDDK